MSAAFWFWAAVILAIFGVFLMSVAVVDLVKTLARERRRRAVVSAPPDYDEKVLLGPVSAWVAEGEARAVYEWAAERSTGKKPIILGPPAEVHPRQPDCGDCEWEELRVLDRAEPIAYIRAVPCEKHRKEPPADISGIKMTEIR